MQSEKFTVKFAETENEKQAVYALRYRDMLAEYRPELAKEGGLDITPYDEFARQIICVDNETGEVVGCYRIITSDGLPEGKSFVSEGEFDIARLKATGERIAELSRAVVKKEYRNSIVLMLLLRFIAQYIREEKFRFIIGEASFFGTDKNALKKELSYLAHYHGATAYDIRSLEKEQVEFLPKEALNAAEIKRNLPPLIRAYLAFGATIPNESFTDWEFGSVDVFILIDFTNYNVSYVDRVLRLS